LRPSEKELEAIHGKSASALKDLEEEYKVYREARLHPKSPELSKPINVENTFAKLKKISTKVPSLLKTSIASIFKTIWEVISQPKKLKFRWNQMITSLKEMVHHYYLGSKLLFNDTKTTKKIVSRMLTGHALTRREHKQLLRTASDIFRMVPLAIFVIIPFMEFLLPFALKIFPNMLPSTFQDSLKQEENMKKELKMRLALAGFLQETVQEMASQKKKAVEKKGKGQGEDEEVALKELIEFIEKAKQGALGNDDITRFARLFKDELTLENISRSQLVSLCLFMGLAPYGGDNFLRFQLRSHLRRIKQDDQRILWEGVSALTKQELQEACRERGMRSMGLTKEGYKRQLGQWLDLSTTKAVPISLLIMSRAFTLEAPDPAKALALSIGSMEPRVVTEVMIEAASNEERKTPEYRAMKLESLARQNELIEMEHQKREENIAKKSRSEASSPEVGPVTSAAVDGEGTTPQASEKDEKEAQKTKEATPKQEKTEKDESISAPKETEEPPKKAKEITAEELNVLESLTSPSSVSKEKAQLAQMKANLSESLQQAKDGSSTAQTQFEDEAAAKETKVSFKSEIETVLGKESAALHPSKEAMQVVEQAAVKIEKIKLADGQETAESVADIDKNLQRMQNKLASMLDKLEVDIETVEAKIGDKLHMLDRDRDGNVGAEELAFVIQHVLSSESTEEAALKIVQDLDVDQDGQISVQELINWVQKHNAEKEEVFDDLFAMQAPSPEEKAKKLSDRMDRNDRKRNE